jgi:hypothetical protein
MRECALQKRKVKGPAKPVATEKGLRAHFVKAGEAKRSSTRKAKSNDNIFSQASDWKFQADLHYDEKNAKVSVRVPDEIVVSALAPDIIIWSSSAKVVVFLELTVPWEDNADKAQWRKSDKYADLEQRCVGWTVHRYAIEVGARGFVFPSFTRAQTKLGVPSKHRKELRRRVAHKALVCSYVLYLDRNNWEWNPRKPLVASWGSQLSDSNQP